MTDRWPLFLTLVVRYLFSYTRGKHNEWGGGVFQREIRRGQEFPKEHSMYLLFVKKREEPIEKV